MLRAVPSKTTWCGKKFRHRSGQKKGKINPDSKIKQMLEVCIFIAVSVWGDMYAYFNTCKLLVIFCGNMCFILVSLKEIRVFNVINISLWQDITETGILCIWSLTVVEYKRGREWEGKLSQHNSLILQIFFLVDYTIESFDCPEWEICTDLFYSVFTKLMCSTNYYCTLNCILR